MWSLVASSELPRLLYISRGSVSDRTLCIGKMREITSPAGIQCERIGQEASHNDTGLGEY